MERSSDANLSPHKSDFSGQETQGESSFNCSSINQPFTIIVEYENFMSEENQVEKISFLPANELIQGQRSSLISIPILMQRLQELDYDLKYFQIFYKGTDEIFTYVGTVPHYLIETIPISPSQIIHFKVRKAVNSNQSNEQITSTSNQLQSITITQAPQVSPQIPIQQIAINTSLPQQNSKGLNTFIKEETHQHKLSGKALRNMAKQMKIKQMINLINEWRKNSNRKTLNCEESAIKLGFNKIILYEWYQRLRDAVQCGFNLLNHRDDSSHVLKNYLKYHLEAEKLIKANDKDISKYQRLAKKSTIMCKQVNCCTPTPYHSELL